MAKEGIELSLKELTKKHVLWLLRENNGDKILTAKELGISQKTLYNWLNKWFGDSSRSFVSESLCNNPTSV